MPRRVAANQGSDGAVGQFLPPARRGEGRLAVRRASRTTEARWDRSGAPRTPPSNPGRRRVVALPLSSKEPEQSVGSDQDHENRDQQARDLALSRRWLILLESALPQAAGRPEACYESEVSERQCKTDARSCQRALASEDKGTHSDQGEACRDQDSEQLRRQPAPPSRRRD